MKKLHLIRHGATKEYERRLYYGATDVPLSENGRALLQQYKENGIYPSPEGCRFVTSGMLRTEETLKALYGEVPHEVEQGFLEMNFGKFEMKSYEELENDPEFRLWCAGDNMANVCPGGESGNQFAHRVRSALKKRLPLKEDTIAVLHGGVIWAIMSELFIDYDRTIYEWQPICGQGYTVEFENGIPTRYYPIEEK